MGSECFKAANGLEQREDLDGHIPLDLLARPGCDTATKVVLVGPGGSGKSSLCSCIATCQMDHQLPLGLQLAGAQIDDTTLRIWDVPGWDTDEFVAMNFLGQDLPQDVNSSSSWLVVVVALGERCGGSADQMEWQNQDILAELTRYTGRVSDDPLIAVVGNNFHRDHLIGPANPILERLATAVGACFFAEVNVKTGTNVKRFFKRLAHNTSRCAIDHEERKSSSLSQLAQLDSRSSN